MPVRIWPYIGISYTTTEYHSSSLARFQTSPPNVVSRATLRAMAVPPHMLKHKANNPSLSDTERKQADKNAQHATQLMQERLDLSRRPGTSTLVLERLVNDESIHCDDVVRREARLALEHNVKRWPGGASEVKVSQAVRAVLEANPRLWEGVQVEDSPGERE